MLAIRTAQESHPSWVCGLKHKILDVVVGSCSVTPFVGVWIETHYPYNSAKPSGVTPFVGVWIETLRPVSILIGQRSHPSWVCGLKLPVGPAMESLGTSHPSWVCGLKPYH